MMKLIASIAVMLCAGVLLLLGGCGTPSAPEIIAVAADTPRLAIPAECKPTGDANWQDLPDRDVRRNESAQNYAGNRRSYRTLRNKRRICYAGMRALQR